MGLGRTMSCVHMGEKCFSGGGIGMAASKTILKCRSFQG